MPIYEYQCPQCGLFEVMQKMSEAPLQECPTCHGPVQKQVSRTSFQLKGGGWYADGYTSAKPKEADKKDAATNEGGSDKKKTDQNKSSETKTATSSKETKSSVASNKSD